MLAGGQGSRLHELTADTCKPAVSFAGGRRIVDWTMDNLVRTQPDKVFVATQYRPAALIDHLNTHWRQGFTSGTLTICEGATVTGRPEGYVGTADAVTRNLDQIAAAAPDVVLVVAADHVYRMDYAAMIAAHRASNRPVTVAVDRVPVEMAHSFGVIEADAMGRVDAFVEKPLCAKPMVGDPAHIMASMGIYVFDWPWLRDTLMRDSSDARSAHDFGHDILPEAVRSDLVQAYDVAAHEPGFYWRDVGTLDALRQTCIDLMDKMSPCLNPAYPAGNSLTDQPTLIVQQNSVVLPGAMVSRGARLRNTIVAPGCVVPGTFEAGYDLEHDATHFRVTPEGTVLITPTMLARHSAGIMRPHLMPNAAHAASLKVTHR
ncbi:sugar phosphate nucleotidyltransferase [Pseudoruegeria sp. SK021]|uniref:sugar phosphate nucleotidyltransferase n=1 Tax=Pseudoruegeria sp. SK021 TaxID=1933035 RepID=UPI001F0AB155|nr:sugar phosphate nucleotidyltransferase [Pseudoruegeria sp. SK021]